MFLLIILEIGAKVWYTFCTVVKYFVKSHRAGSDVAEFRDFILCFAANYKKGERAARRCINVWICMTTTKSMKKTKANSRSVRL